MKDKLMVILLVALLVTGCCTNAAVAAGPEDIDTEYLQGVMRFIKDNYSQEIDRQPFIENTVRAMFHGLDDYTEFFSREEAHRFMDDYRGGYEGIGVILMENHDSIVIAHVFPGSPAQRAGLLPGDRLVSVDGEPVGKSSATSISGKIKGESGTIVYLGIVRPGGQQAIYPVNRAAVKISPVRLEVNEDVAYVVLESFNSYAPECLQEALQEIDSYNINKIILDLRGNGGGGVDQAVEIAEHFVPGEITTLSFKQSQKQDVTYVSNLKNIKYQLVVLVDRETASASEILAGAIQDSGAGVLVGEPTFGKARVQSFMPILTPEAYQKYRNQGIDSVSAYDLVVNNHINLRENELLGWAKVTTGIYYTPSGRNIDGEGLHPDFITGDIKVVRDVDIRSITRLTRSMKPGLGSISLDVLNAEKILRMSGYDVGVPDLEMDAATVEALSRFQEDYRLNPGGVLDFATQDALNHQLNKLRTQYDNAYRKALELF